MFLLVFVVLGAACSSSSGQPQSGTTPLVVSSTPAVAESEGSSPEVVLESYLQAWREHDWTALAGLVFDTGEDPAAAHLQMYDSLRVTATSTKVDELKIDGRRATATVSVTLSLDRTGDWTYPTTVELIEVDSQWAVEWLPATLYPGLREGRRLVRLRVWPERAALLARDGEPLRVDLPVTAIGLEPGRIEDRDSLLVQLEDLLGVDPQQVADDLDAPGVQADWFVPVATLRTEDYQQLDGNVSALAGVVVREGTDRLGPTDGYAQQVLGATGPITAEQLAQWGEPYDGGSRVGRSGLELAFELELAGTPTAEIRLLDAADTLLSVIERFPGRPPVDVETSLDVAAQAAAEAALDGVEQPAALVAVDAASGQLRAVVSRPIDGFGRAIAGAYPPGSTFKTITAAAFLQGGATPSTSVPCPPRVVVTGLPFSNAGGSSLGTVSLQTAFARSCNTAFVNVATGLAEGALAQAASDFGFGRAYSIGLDTAGGSYPEPVDDAELAASAIGQARVTASPLHMATVAAAIADGTWREPVLVLGPAAEQGGESIKIDPQVVTDLQVLMRAAVTNGTGAAAAGVGGDISGKTGSAEYGNEEPPETHAWFIGYSDGLAFAVLVEGGGGGGAVAAPIAAAFLNALAP